MAHTKKGLTSITLAFNEALSAGSANRPALYSVLAGVKKHGKLVFKKALGVRSAAYNDSAHSVTITLAKPYKGVAQVTVQSGLAAASGATSSSSSRAFIT